MCLQKKANIFLCILTSPIINSNTKNKTHLFIVILQNLRFCKITIKKLFDFDQQQQFASNNAFYHWGFCWFGIMGFWGWSPIKTPIITTNTIYSNVRCTPSIFGKTVGNVIKVCQGVFLSNITYFACCCEATPLGCFARRRTHQHHPFVKISYFVQISYFMVIGAGDWTDCPNTPYTPLLTNLLLDIASQCKGQ